jgi:Carboxypeptidase regulatory-like domain
MRVRRAVGVVFLSFALIAPAFCQTGTSTIRGTVTDQQGRVIPNADVTLINVETNAVRTGKSTDTGAFTFDLIIPGTYRLTIKEEGFKTKEIDNVKALVGKQTEANAELEVGTTGDVVEVKSTADEVLINTQDASLGNNFVSQQITQLPLEARNVIDLLSLQPGSTREGYVTGARADQSNVTLDGVDINNAQSGNAEVPRSTNNLMIGALDNDRGDVTTGPVLRLNAEAIDEFRVTTANGNADQGRSSGAQVNLVTKAGTNNWHGAGFEFYRTRGFTANDWFNNHATDADGNSAPIARPPLQRNTFGGALGGPILKNRAFFFYSYEGRHDASSTSEARLVPLANLGNGIINYTYCTDASCSNTQEASLSLTQNQQAFADAGINQAALDALAAAAAKYPSNDTTQGDGLNVGSFRFNAPTPTRLNSHVAKFDFNLTNTQTAFVRLNVIYDHQTLPQWLPDTPSPQVWSHPWGLAAGHTWTIGNNWVNNFRYGYTRQAYTQGGDSSGNDVDFRFVFQPTGETHPIERVTPVHNFTDDVSWIHGSHNIQFGTNIRTVSNTRTDFTNAFDFAEVNPFFYLNTGANISGDFQAYLDSDPTLKGNESNGQSLASPIEVEDAGAAIIGRLNQFTSNFGFDQKGNLLPAGSPSVRDFATQAYDMYVQDTWKVNKALTLTLGLRYSLERPVYETQGFEVQPTVPLGDYLAERAASAANGQNFVDPIVINRSGPVNGGPPMYNWDKNNFQPRLAFAWSPEGGDGFFGRLLGSGQKSVLRGGFSMTNDYYGQALAVDWDINNTLGFTSNFTAAANTFNSDLSNANHGLAPLFTGFGQDVRSLVPAAGGSIPTGLTFPISQPLDNGERIEQSVDSNLHAPTQYVFNLTFERELPKGAVFSASYIGRMGRSLLARHDVAQFSDLRDPKTGMDWYTAGTILEKQRQKGVPIDQIASIPYFDDLFPANLAQIVNNFEGAGTFNPAWTNTQVFYGYQDPSVGFFEANDWTDVQAELDQALAAGGLPTAFMQPQYGALSTWSTIGNANYNALAVSLRQRLSSLTMDFNYTWSHSLDDASGLQGEAGYGNWQGNGAFILNAFRQRDNYASSDFDVRHNINVDAIWQLPFGKGKTFLGDASSAVDAVLGGWQLSGIFRWNTGLPVTSPIDDGRWATDWEVQSNVTPINPIHSCPNKPVNGTPNLFGNCDINAIYQNFRNAYPGETGPRNYLRYPGYVDIDLGLGKSWKMPWNENHELQARWDVFNVTNTQSLTGFSNDGVQADPGLNKDTAPPDFYNFTQIQGQPRVMQVGLRYSF